MKFARPGVQFAAVGRVLIVLLVVGLLVADSNTRAVNSDGEASAETRFWTGCDPGPYPQSPYPEHHQSEVPRPTGPRSAAFIIDLDSAADHRPLLGSGFNFEHALWSCPQFQGLLQSEILDAFQPALARVDTGLLPAAPPSLPAASLGPSVYSSILSSSPYASSWSFLKRLNRVGLPVVLGVWGGPAQFTLENERLGDLEPRHYDDYVEYVASVVEFLVHDQGVRVWATTVANEPDGGDGNAIPPDGLAYIAHRLAERLAPLGVKLYGPDTSSSASTMQYLPLLLDDPTVAINLAFVGFHEYYATRDVSAVVDYVRARQPELPVIVTEYTSFGFGDLDAGQEANDGVGFMLDVANTVLSHYRDNVDAALYWDAVDYLQPGHEAITRWGILRGPQRDFARRRRYYALVQILRYLQPGTRIMDMRAEDGTSNLGYLAVQTPSGAPAIFLVNQSADPIDVTLQVTGADATKYPRFSVWRTDRERKAERLGRVRFSDGAGTVTLPPRSVTTLFPPGAPMDQTDSGP
jgi:O-glycosyl hydrolase